MRMIFEKTPIENLLIIKNIENQDSRGAFSRIFCFDELKENNIKFEIKQINVSKTLKMGTLRGLHFQNYPYNETKLIKCIKGKIFDVAVDLRKNSKSFLKWFGIELNENSNKLFLIPKGFAHGFQTLTDNVEILYMHDQFYNKEYEGKFNYKDPILNIKWPLNISNISDEDLNSSFIDNDFKGINYEL